MPRSTPWLLVATLTAAGAAAAAGYGLTAPKRYTATADLLVAPVAAADPVFAGLDLLRDAAGKRAAAETASVLVRSPQVADAVRTQLGLRMSREALLASVHAHVAGGSDVVAVSAEETSAASAAQLANAFVDALVSERTTSFQSELGSAIRHDAEVLARSPSGPEAAALARRLAVLRSFQGQQDPTLRRASTATAPTSSSWPTLWALVLVGAAAGLVLGLLLLLVLALLRRGVPGMQQEYSRSVSGDSSAEALVDRLEQRLAGRESALAARERDLQARIDELRALEAPRAADSGAPAGLSEREQELEARASELAEREQALAERVAAVTQRELALARAAAQAEPPAAATASPPPPAPAALPAQAPAGEVSGAFNLVELERLVAVEGGAHPERRDEWQSTLFFLRDYAGPEGALPGSFDWLVQDTFAPILAQGPVSLRR